MKIEKDRVVTLEYKLSTDKGALIESSLGRGAPVAFIAGRGFMLPGLDEKLEGLEGGEKKAFELPPEEAFGTVEQQQTNWMQRSEFPDDAAFEVGSKFQAKLPQNNLQITLEVVEVEEERINVRMIHPFADMTINCEVEVVGVRAATPQELDTGVVEAVAPAKSGNAPPPPPPGDVDSLEELDVEPDEEDGSDEDSEDEDSEDGDSEDSKDD